MPGLERPVYCLQCARAANYRGLSLDGVRPMVRCYWKADDGTEHGHGVQVGTFDRAEAQADVDTRLEARRLAVHRKGGHDTKPSPSCPPCRLAMYHKGHVKRRYVDPDCALCHPSPAAQAELIAQR